MLRMFTVIKVLFFFFFLPQGAPPSDAPAVDTAEQVYISSLALLKVGIGHFSKALGERSIILIWP